MNKLVVEARITDNQLYSLGDTVVLLFSIV